MEGYLMLWVLIVLFIVCLAFYHADDDDFTDKWGNEI